MTLQTQIDAYLATRVAYDEAHEESSALHRQHLAAKTALVEAMVAEEKQSVKFDVDSRYPGMNFFLKQQFSISCTEANNDQVKDWLHEQYGDVHEFTTEKVVKRTVEERLKNDIEGEKLDEFEVPDFMKLKTRPDVSVTGYKQYSAEQRK